MKCPKCKKMFYQPDMLRRHIRFFHGIRDGEVIVCVENNCFQIFMKVFNFIRHCKNCHFTKNIPKESRIVSIDCLPTNNLQDNFIETADSSTHTVQSYNSNQLVQSYDSNHTLLDNTIERVKNIATQHCIDLLSQSNITVTTAVNNIEKTSDLISHCILYLKQRMEDVFGNILSEEHNNLLQKFDMLLLVLKPYSTTSQLQNLAKNWPTYVAPVEVELGVRYENRSKSGVMRLIRIKETFQQIPLKELFIKFFSLKGVLNTVMQYKQRAKNTVNEMINIQQGTYYKNHEILSTEDNIIALEFYIDDVEITNSLKLEFIKLALFISR